ncbi:nucleophile aminohydrolase, partial [Pavlovales sp. CCMP2436]
LTALLAPRGPDEVGCHVGRGFALGHARLSIMDPVGGQQPLLHAPTGNALVHNGEIYNYVQLRECAALEAAELGRPPPVYSTASDSESVLPLFELHGAGVAAMLDGMFALVVVRSDGSAFAARDPCGIKPLYRGWSASGRVLFASELKCLVGQVEHAEVFPAGHFWTSEGGYERYFAPQWLAPTLGPSTAALPTGGMENVRALLKKAVAKRLMSDVGYGLLLSGGLDSAIVCTLMAELTDMSKIKSFTVGMPNSPDIMAAREVARHFGTDHY